MALFGVLYDGDTKFNHYRVADTMYCGRPARVLYSGSNEAAQSGVARDGKEELLFDYNQRFLELIRGVRPGSLLILGGGAFTLPAAVRAEFPEVLIDIVEIDDALPGIASRYFGFEPDERTRIFIDDARHYIDTATATYDVIIVDVFTHSTIPDAFQTPEFGWGVKKCLNRKGLVAMNIVASLYGRRAAPLYRIQEVMQATFLDVAIFAADRSLSPWTVQNYDLTAQDHSRDMASLFGYAPIAIPK